MKAGMTGLQTEPRTRPQGYEVITGWGAERRVATTHSRNEAEAEYDRQRKAGRDPALFLGNLLLAVADETSAARVAEGAAQ